MGKRGFDEEEALRKLREDGYYLYRFHTFEVIGDCVAYSANAAYEVDGDHEPYDVGCRLFRDGGDGTGMTIYQDEIWALAKSRIQALRHIGPLVRQLLDLPGDWVVNMVQADKKLRERMRLEQELKELLNEIEAALRETDRLEPEWFNVAEVIRTAMAVGLQKGSISELKDACRKLAKRLQNK